MKVIDSKTVLTVLLYFYAEINSNQWKGALYRKGNDGFPKLKQHAVGVG